MDVSGSFLRNVSGDALTVSVRRHPLALAAADFHGYNVIDTLS